MLNNINHLFDYILPTLSLTTIGLIILKKQKSLYLFIPYLFFICFLFISVVPFNFFNSPLKLANFRVVKYETINFTFTLVEFFTFYLFFYKNISYKKSKKILSLLFSAFILVFLIITNTLINLTDNFIAFSKASYFTTQVEYLIILFFSLIYFRDYLKQDYSKPLSEIFSLRIISAIFIYTSVSLPFIIISIDINPTSLTYKLLTLLHYCSLSFVVAIILFSSSIKKISK